MKHIKKMMCYWFHPRYWVFGKGYGFLSFAENMSKNIGRVISKILSSQYTQKRFDLVTGALKIAPKVAAQNLKKNARGNSKFDW